MNSLFESAFSSPSTTMSGSPFLTTNFPFVTKNSTIFTFLLIFTFSHSLKTTKKTPQRASLRRFLGFCAAECLSNFSLICCAYTIAPEQKARVTYDNILKVCDDPDVTKVIKYLREREVVHFQRFGEALDKIQQNLTEKNKFYMSK
ncbi:MAG: manganese catalase family protein [Eubacteriales bacterium]|nr:manganese catalase family protein [Eubacteriales bacterium]